MEVNKNKVKKLIDSTKINKRIVTISENVSNQEADFKNKTK